jgi:NADPH:quinone reductase-like Zn-dependent oxidoreductase
MRAWTFSRRGDPSDILKLSTTLPAPAPPTGSNLLIRISHVGLSSAGINLMHDVLSALRRGAIPEIDFSGRVANAGPSGPSSFTIGTPVFGKIPPSASILSGAGSMAEYVLVPAENVAVKPAKVRFVEAAGLGGLGQTALKMLEKADVKRGDWVLIHGGSGGVGTVAIQAAKAAGARVVATCSGGNADMVRVAGADEVGSVLFASILRAFPWPIFKYPQMRLMIQ